MGFKLAKEQSIEINGVKFVFAPITHRTRASIIASLSRLQGMTAASYGEVVGETTDMLGKVITSIDHPYAVEHGIPKFLNDLADENEFMKILNCVLETSGLTDGERKNSHSSLSTNTVAPGEEKKTAAKSIHLTDASATDDDN